MTAPLTQERLAFAREWVAGFCYEMGDQDWVPAQLLAEVDRLRAQVAAERLTAWLHARWEFDLDECHHGTYSGGPSHGKPFAMCERWGGALAATLASGDEEQR